MINPLIIKDDKCDNSQASLDISLLGKTCNENGGNGQPGKDGLSAFQIAVLAGFQGNYIQWLASLVGPAGLSAYQLALLEGFEGTVAEWLLSLVGKDGKSAYDLAVDGGFEGSVEEWLFYLANNYTLPIASDVILGGIRIGDGLTIDANGVVSLDIAIDLQSSTNAGNRTTNDIILEESRLIIEGPEPADPYALFLSSIAYTGGIYRYSGGIAKDGSGKLYGASNQGLSLISGNGLVATDIATWGNQPVGGIAYYNGYIYASLFNLNKIVRVNLATNAVTDYITTGLNYPMGITFNDAGQLFVFDAMNRRVLRYATGGTVGTVVAGGNGYGSALNQFGEYPANGAQIAVHNNELYIADYGNDRVLRWPVSAAAASQAYAVENAKTVAVAPNGDLYVGSYNGAGSTENLYLVLFPADGSPRQTLLTLGDSPMDLADIILDASGKPEYFSQYESSAIYKAVGIDVVISNQGGKAFSNDKRLLDTDDLFGQQDIDFSTINTNITNVDQGALHKAGNESTLPGAIKTFVSSPLVPDPTLNEQAMNLRKGRALPLDGVFSRNIGVIARDEVVSVSASYSKNFLQLTPANNYTHVKLFCTDGNSYVRAYEIQCGYDSNRFQSWQQLTPYQAYTDRAADFHIDIKAIDGFGPVNFGLLFRIRGVIATSMSYRIEYHHMYPAVGTDFLDWTKLTTPQYLSSTQPITGVYPFQNEKATVSQLNTAVTFLQNQLNTLLPMTGELSPAAIAAMALIDDGDTSGLVDNAAYKTSTGFIKYAVPGGAGSVFTSEFTSEFQ